MEPQTLKVSPNGFINPLLTDFYQVTMSYGYWKCGRHNQTSVFDVYFRKHPFKGQFTIFGGLEEVLKLIANYKMTDEYVDFIRTQMPHAEDAYFEWLKTLDGNQVKAWALPEGTLAFPSVPVITLEGPIALLQLLETPILNLVNFPSLMATNAARFRLAAPGKTLMEFGLRRAQGPDGAMSASKYSVLGGFDSSSNVLAGFEYGIPIKGTQAHSFVTSFTGLDDLTEHSDTFKMKNGECLLKESLKAREELGYNHTNDGELAAFIAYAYAYPDAFLALVDTYDTLESGVPNFIAVSVALKNMGHEPTGIRLDSGDLAFLSKSARKMFQDLKADKNIDLGDLKIVASNDINEPKLHMLREVGHEIDVFGIGTNLVTCQAQPALGMVYKLVQSRGAPRIKLSQEAEKVTLPGKKAAYRLYGKDDKPLLDVMILSDEAAPEVGKEFLCRHPTKPNERSYVTPSRVHKLHSLIYDGTLKERLPTLQESRQYVVDQLKTMRPEILDLKEPEKYSVMLSSALYELFHKVWMQECPIKKVS